LRARLLEPLGLTETEPAITADVRLRLAVGYDRLHGDGIPDPADPLVPAPWVETATADGSLAATAGDLAAFARFLMQGEAERLTSGPLLECGDGWSYGYGLETRVVAGRRFFRHGGSMPGHSCTMLGDLDSDLAVAVVMNGPDEGDVTEAIADYVLALHRGENPDPPGESQSRSPTPLGAPRGEWSGLYGRYGSYDPWLPGFRVVQWEDGLGLVFFWGLEEPLTPLEDGVFRVGKEDWSPERLRFDAIVHGQSLRANLSGGDYYRSDFD
jgi:CubicO group peptidase (beta-lactamase class C family)